MLTQPQQPLMTSADPLAMQFMTGGQMGYMPQAQYLTPADYGAFRTLPVPQQHSFLGQDPGFFQSMLIRNYGSLFGLPKYTWNTYNPAVNQQLYMSNITRQSWDQMAGGAAAALDAVLPMAAMGMLGGIPGAALGMMMPSLADPLVNRIRDMRTIQNMTMSKIVGGRDMNAATGMGFNAAAGRGIDSFLRTQAAGDVLFKEGDYRKLMQLGVENGIFDYASNAQQYKDIVKKLRNSMTTMMEVVGSTDFKDLMKEFKRMQTMGADISQFQTIARKENMFSRITGLSHADMVSTYGQQGALIFSQAGLNNYQGSLAAMSNAAAVTLGQRMGLLTPAQVARHGGVSGMAQTLTQEDAQAQNRAKDILLPYLMNGQLNGLDDNANLGDLLRNQDALRTLMSSGHKIRGPEQMMAYQRNKDDVWGQAIDKFGQDTLMGVLAHVTGREVGLRGEAASEYGFRMQGYSPEMARIKSNHLHSREFAEQVEREAALERKKRREEEDLARNPFRKFARDVDSLLTRAGEATYGRIVDAYGAWSARRELEASGMVDLRSALNGPVTSAELDMARGPGGGAGSGPVYTGPAVEVVNKDNIRDWYAANSRLVQMETSMTGQGSMRKVSMRMDSSGRLKGLFADKGGSSFGSMQFTTGNMISFFNRGGAQAEKERAFLKERYGLDIADADTQDLLRNTARKIGNVQKVGGKYQQPNLTSDEAKALKALQDGYLGLLDDAELSEQMNIDYLNVGMQNSLGAVRKAAQKDQKLDATMKNSGFLAYYTDLSNNMGGGGASSRVRWALSDLSQEAIDSMMATPEGRQKLFRHINDRVLQRYESQQAGWRAAGSKSAVDEKTMRAVIKRWRDAEGHYLAAVGGEPSTNPPSLSSAQEAYRKREAEDAAALAQKLAGDDVLTQARLDGNIRTKQDRDMLAKTLSAQAGSDEASAKRLSDLFGRQGIHVKLGANELAALSRDLFETEGLFSRSDFQSHSNMQGKARDRLREYFKKQGVEVSDAQLTALMENGDVTAILAGSQLRRGDEDTKDELNRLHALNSDDQKHRDVALREYQDRTSAQFTEDLDQALGKDATAEKELVRDKTALNQVYWLGELARSVHHTKNLNPRTAELQHKGLQEIAAKLGISPKALETVIREGKLSVQDIKNTAGKKLTQAEVDKVLKLGTANADTNEDNSDYLDRFALYKRMASADSGVSGMAPTDALLSSYMARSVGMEEFARKYGYKNAEEMYADPSRLEDSVINSGVATRSDIALARRLLADKKRGIDLQANALKYAPAEYDVGKVRAADAGSVRATQEGSFAEILSQMGVGSNSGSNASASPGNTGLADSTINKLADTISQLNGVLRKLDDKLKPGS